MVRILYNIRDKQTDTDKEQKQQNHTDRAKGMPSRQSPFARKTKENIIIQTFVFNIFNISLHR